jgi:hypothetical protein
VEEMRLSVKDGYLLFRIHELYEYEVNAYNLKTGE